MRRTDSRRLQTRSRVSRSLSTVALAEVGKSLDRQRLGLTDIILCEVLQGVHDDSAAADVERQLRKLEVFETGGVELAKPRGTIVSYEPAVTRCARRSIV